MLWNKQKVYELYHRPDEVVAAQCGDVYVSDLSFKTGGVPVLHDVVRVHEETV